MAKPRWEPDEPIRRRFSLGVTLLKEHGFGLAVRGRLNHFGVEASGGGNGYLMFTSGDCREFLFGVAPHVTASFLFFFNGHERFFQSGLRLGGIWDGLFGFGGMLGYVGEMSLTKLIALQAGAGLQVYPEGGDGPQELVEEKCGGSSEISPLATHVQAYVGINVLFYLF